MQSGKQLAYVTGLVFTISLLAACGGEPVEQTAAGSNKQDHAAQPMPAHSSIYPVTPPPAPGEAPPPASAAKLLLQGSVTYDRVPFDSRLYKGLDYSQTVAVPSRGVTVQLLDDADRLLAETATDEHGGYAFRLSPNSRVKVRVVAELVGRSSAAWSVQVRDNTRDNAQYVMEGVLTDVGKADQIRDLHAASGWGGSDYSSVRSAAPFAILDSVYDAIKLVVAADPQVVMPPLNVFWSEKNISASGQLRNGHIGTSFYTSAGPAIYLLGAANNDADEYDRAVIQHEFAHFLEHQLGRSENIGGSHNTSSKLDMRVAFSEAWGNAFSAMASNDPVYRDSMGARQSQGFSFNVSRRSFGAQGWFSEGSIQTILYHLTHPGGSQREFAYLGFPAVYQALSSSEYAEFDGLASIYSFMAVVKQKHPEKTLELNRLMESFSIFGSGGFGEGESNNAGFDALLPVYSRLTQGASTRVCSNKSSQQYNGVDVRRFARLDISADGHYRISAAKAPGSELSTTNPELRLLRKGRQIASARSTAGNWEEMQRYLTAGTYILEVYEASNVDQKGTTGGLACFDVRLD